MAEEETPLSLLNLEIERGPRSGETLQFLPTDPPVRLGRFVRGNSVTIKDPSISTKHLTIEFKSPHWLITDLASSNGTVLNSSLLPSLSPTVLRDGDLVKIGEATVIKVGIQVGRSRIGKSGGDVSEGEFPRGRMRREKAVEESVGAIGEDGELGFGGELGKKGVGVVTRGRGRSKREKGEIFSEKVGVAAEVFEKKTRGRRGKEKVPDAEDLGSVNVKPGPQVSTRRTRRVRLVENAEKENVDVRISGVKMTEKGKKRNNNKEGNCSENGNVIDVRSGDGLNSERVVVKNEPRESFCEERERGGESVKESGFKSLEAPDLTKMTLRDYFDYLEVSLPKQIIEETELIIAEMHKKAEMYREFVRENKKGKGTCK